MTKGKRIGSTKGGPSVLLAVRFTPKMVAAIDRATKVLAKERPELDITRADTVRGLVAEALAARGIE